MSDWLFIGGAGFMVDMEDFDIEKPTDPIVWMTVGDVKDRKKSKRTIF